MEIYLWSGGGLLVLTLLASFRMHVEQYRRIARLGDRIAQLTAGVSLLTDTIEGGLRDVAQEIDRLSAVQTGPHTKRRAATQKRVSSAAGRGRSVQEIAAEEQMSEGEVRLRMQLAAASRERAHAAVR